MHNREQRRARRCAFANRNSRVTTRGSVTRVHAHKNLRLTNMREYLAPSCLFQMDLLTRRSLHGRQLLPFVTDPVLVPVYTRPV